MLRVVQSISLLVLFAFPSVMCSYTYTYPTQNNNYDEIHNITSSSLSSSSFSLHNNNINSTDPTNDFVASDLRIQNIQEHRRLGTDPAYRLWDNWWKNGYHWIRVYIDPSYSSTNRNLIIKSLRSVQYRAKVVKFEILKNKSNKPYINIINGSNGCWSYYGRNYDAHMGQDLSLSENGCMTARIIQHELFHALGIAHEHSRPDRDQHVTILLENVKSNFRSEFDIWQNIKSMGIPYDLNSIMHYDEYTWSINPPPHSRSYPTIVPKNNKKIGTLTDASWNDIVLLRLMYQCKSSVGPRTQNQFNAQACTVNCPCWKKRPGCSGKDALCKGNLKCRRNVCVDP